MCVSKKLKDCFVDTIHYSIRGACDHLIPAKFCITTHLLYYPEANAKRIIKLMLPSKSYSTYKFKIKADDRKRHSLSHLESELVLLQIKTQLASRGSFLAIVTFPPQAAATLATLFDGVVTIVTITTCTTEQ